MLAVITTYGQAILEARVKNLPKGNVYLWNTTTDNIDTVAIENDSFVYKADLTEPTLFNVKFEGYNDWDYPMRLVLSNSPTSLTLEQVKQVKQGNWKDLYPNKPIFHLDPNRNQQLLGFETSWQVFSDSVVKLSPETGDNDILLEKRKSLYNEFIHDSETFIKSNPDRVISAVAIFEYVVRNRMIDIDKTKEFYLLMDDVVKYSHAGIRIGSHINRELSIEVGKPAPYFEFRDSKGNKHDLSQFKNKTVLLHFWSSTCGPCRVENKKIKALNVTDPKIVIINVSLDTDEKRWKKAIATDGLSEMLNTSDLKGVNGKMVQDYYIHGIPTHYLIDGEGRISSKGSLEEVQRKLKRMPDHAR